jgi:hypothetical protein
VIGVTSRKYRLALAIAACSRILDTRRSNRHPSASSRPGERREGITLTMRTTGTILGTLLLANAAAAQFVQQGNKLVGAGAVGPAQQGSSVAVAADGNTAAVGAWQDNSVAGATWVFARNGSAWSQQGSKLVGAGAVGPAAQGSSVAISGDGNTLIVGGPFDNGNTGAWWVFTRSGSVWSQQGSKLVGMGAVGAAWQGNSVAISADGNTLIVGGYVDDSLTGAAWVFTRSGNAWSQQGPKLVGTGAVGAAQQGSAVAISADGNTAIVGGFNDDSGIGAAWVFTRTAGVWSQQGDKLVGTDYVGKPAQGWSVAISGDGDTAIVGGAGDDSGIGAAWVFRRSGGVWRQPFHKLIGVPYYDPDNHIVEGSAVAMSGDGKTAIVCGRHDAAYVGAFWAFNRNLEIWSQRGFKTVGTGAVGFAHQGTSGALSADGTTAIIGGYLDNSSLGASWVFTNTLCTAPWISVQPQSQSVQSGQTAVLSMTALGPTPLSYQWYQGASGDTSTPVGTNATSFTTPALTVATAYWVRVSNACGRADSTTATITIGSACTPPSITAQPQSRTVASGHAATLSVTATGTAPLSYHWYQGNAGDASIPVGADASTFTTPPLTAQTSFWVRISSPCGSADSQTATVAVGHTVRRHLRGPT